jgi:LTXXQ motif family protein
MTLKFMLNRLRAVSGCSTSIIAAVAALLIAFSASAFAQSDPHHPDSAKQAAPAQDMHMPGGVDGTMGMMMRGGGMMGMMENCPMMGGTAHSEGRIAFLKAELAISDQQKAAWEVYAAGLKKNLEGMQGMRQTMMKVVQAKSPVERLDAHIGAMDNRVTALKGLKPALANLYDSLSDDQKKKADELLTGMGCMM